MDKINVAPKSARYTKAIVSDSRKQKLLLDPIGFQQIPNVLLNDVAKGKLKAKDIAVYMAFKRFAGYGESGYGGNSSVSYLTGIKPKSLRESIARLTKAGHIRRSPRDAGLTWNTHLLATFVDGKVVWSPPREDMPAVNMPPPKPRPIEGFDIEDAAGDEHSFPL